MVVKICSALISESVRKVAVHHGFSSESSMVATTKCDAVQLLAG